MKQRKNLKQRLKESRYNPTYLSYQLAIDVSVQISKIMDEREINRTTLAQMLGCSKSYISQILDGYPNLTFKTLGKIAAALQMDIKSPKFYHKDMESFGATLINSNDSVNVKINDISSNDEDHLKLAG